MKTQSFSVLTAAFTLAISSLMAPKGCGAAPPASGTSPRPVTENGGDLFEVSLGYDYIHLGSGADLDHLHGVDTSAFVNVTRWLGIGAEFTAAFGSDEVGRGLHVDDTRYIYLVGPRLNVWPTDKIRVFGQLLAGGFHAEVKEDVSNFLIQKVSGDAFAYSVGVGADWRFAPHLYWRVLQTDYLHMNFKHQEDNWRLTTGLVFAFGGKK